MNDLSKFTAEQLQEIVNKQTRDLDLLRESLRQYQDELRWCKRVIENLAKGIGRYD